VDIDDDSKITNKSKHNKYRAKPPENKRTAHGI